MNNRVVTLNTPLWMVTASAAGLLMMNSGHTTDDAPRMKSAPELAGIETDVAVLCRAIARVDFSRIPDAPTQVIDTQVIPAAENVPAHCTVRGYISPSIGIELKLPAQDWNGKLLQVGCGGFCGVLFDRYSPNRSSCDQGLRKGYACIASDQGHRSTMFDVKWAYNNQQAQIDYAFRATHVVALASKAITERYYDRVPGKSYFWGCAAGGREGIVAAQLFPYDFDGIAVVAPALNISSHLMSFMWNARVATREGQALFSQADVEWIHRTVLAKCDMDDNVQDGIIGNPSACKIAPAEWTCESETQVHCLSNAQAEALAKIYAGPTDSHGEKLFVGIVPGAERKAIPTVSESSAAFESSLFADFFRYMGFMPAPGPNWKPSDFNYDRDFKRIALGQALMTDANPDLRKFKGAGGKLILAVGWMDGDNPLNTIDYYETVERTMGGREATQVFLRLFTVPGMGQCSGEDPGTVAIDYLSYLEDWVERGNAPDVIIGAHVKPEPEGLRDFTLPIDPARVMFTRPVYPYPRWAKYRGTGDTRDSRSFRSVTHPSH